MKKLFATVISLLITLAVSAQLTARQDSLLNLGRMWRDNKNYLMAIDQFMRAGGDEAEYEVALTHYYMGKIALSLDESKTIVSRDNHFSTDANVLMALCRERQGYDRAAARIYKKMVKEKNSAWAAYYYARMLHRKGHLGEAEEFVQKSILIDKAIPDSHYLLATLKAQQGCRFEAMLPLYYFLLISDNEDNNRLAYDLLIRLWRRSAQAIEIIKSNKVVDPFNAGVDAYINTIATSDSIAKLSGVKQIEKLYDNTDKLMRHLLATSEQHLDFFQVAYTDFFVTLVPRNFIKPYVYFISDASHHVSVLEYISTDEYLFNEFRLWMEAQ